MQKLLNAHYVYTFVLLGFLATLFAAPLAAEGEDHFNKSWVSDFAFTSERLHSLADAIPENKYDWSPGEGVRSVKDVLVHVIEANYAFSAAIGTPRPDDYESMLEGADSKAKLLDVLQKSSAQMKMAAESYAGKDIDGTMVSFGGGESPVRRVLSIARGHVHEHLGQTIAYARANDVTPPWSQQQ